MELIKNDIVVISRSLSAWRVVALTAVVLLAGWVVAPSEAAQRKDPLEGLTSAQRRIFQNYTRLYCQQFFKFEDRFVLLPNYERSRENSTGRSYDQAFEEMTEKKTIYPAGNTIPKEIQIKPETAEVIVAAKMIPAIDVGHYGFVNSVTVKDIIGPNEMIVTSIELIPQSEVSKFEELDKQAQESALFGVEQIDEEQLQEANKKYVYRRAAAERQKAYLYSSYRLLGYNTKDLNPGDKYFGPQKKGMQVAVMSTDPQHEFVLVNYDLLQRVSTREFPDALTYVEIEPLMFLDMVRENREKYTTEGDKASLISIYRRYYNRYRPKRLSSIVQLEPQPEVQPEPQPEPQPQRPTTEDLTPEPEPEVAPEPVRPDPPRIEPDAEAEEDEWDLQEDTPSESDTPTFFGIPL